MPRFRTTMLDGTTYEGDFASADLAKRAHKNEARQKSGATERTDPAVKVQHVVNLDEEPGPTDPLEDRRRQAAADRDATRGRGASSDRDRAGTSDRDRAGTSDRDRAGTSDRERQDREERERRDREERERREREERR